MVGSWTVKEMHHRVDAKVIAAIMNRWRMETFICIVFLRLVGEVQVPTLLPTKNGQ